MLLRCHSSRPSLSVHDGFWGFGRSGSWSMHSRISKQWFNCEWDRATWGLHQEAPCFPLRFSVFLPVPHVGCVPYGALLCTQSSQGYPCATERRWMSSQSFSSSPRFLMNLSTWQKKDDRAWISLIKYSTWCYVRSRCQISRCKSCPMLSMPMPVVFAALRCSYLLLIFSDNQRDHGQLLIFTQPHKAGFGQMAAGIKCVSMPY